VRIILARQNKKTIKRKLAYATVGCCVGIIGGNILVLDQYVSLLFLLVFLIGLVAYLILYYQKEAALLLIAAVILGIALVLMHPIQDEAALWEKERFYDLYGEVTNVKQTDYCQWVTIDHVQYKQESLWQSLKSKVQLKLEKPAQLTDNDLISVKVKYLLGEEQMNPSDFDTPLYLKGQGIVASFKVLSVQKIIPQDTIQERIKEAIIERINILYDETVRGIMKACIIGGDDEILKDTKDIYNQSGIGHVLSISGFHVGVIISSILALLSLLKIAYTPRQVITIVCIWVYASLTGESISTMRAVIMATVLIGGRCLWQEEDKLTDVAIAAASILLINPYQLFQVGFQLSFGAVLSLFFCLDQIEKKELYGEWQYTKGQKTLLMWAGIQLGTAPILAYHFYEIPFWISVLNLIIIPLFSALIIGGWLSVIFFPLTPIAECIAFVITIVLKAVEGITGFLLKLPLATLCIGRPSMIEGLLYGGVVLVLISLIFNRSMKRNAQFMIILSAICYFFG